MRSTINLLPGSQAKLTIEATSEEMQKYRMEAIEKLRTQNTQDGGADKSNEEIEKEYGGTRIDSEMLQLLAPHLYGVCISEQDVQPIAQANSVVLGISPVRMEFTVDVFPKVELRLPELEIDKQEAAVEPGEVEAALERVSKDYGEYSEVEEVEAGDRLVIDFTGKVDGETNENLNAKDFPLDVGSQTFIPGFEDGLMGKKKDEKVTLSLTFPPEYHAKEYQGKAAEFEVEIKSIKRNEPAELTDEFIQKVTDNQIQNKEDLEKDIAEKIKERKQLDFGKNQELLIGEKLIEVNEIDLPEAMIATELEYMIASLKQNIEQGGMTFEQFTEQRGVTEEDIKKDLEKEAVKRLKIRVILLTYAKEAKIEVSKEEIDEMMLKNETESQEKFEQMQAIHKTELLLKKSLESLRQKYVK